VILASKILMIVGRNQLGYSQRKFEENRYMY